MNEKDNNIFANLNTNYSSFAYVTTIGIAKDFETPIINLQIDCLREAINKYSNKVKNNNNPKLEDMISILRLLGDSLTALFGANYEKSGRTPELRKFINETFPNEIGWKLKDDDKYLYEKFIELDDYHKDIAKHFSRAKSGKALTVNKYKLEEFIETTRQVWLWFIKKYFEKHNDGIIPQGLLDEFNDLFNSV